jgi:hypothetical protein
MRRCYNDVCVGGGGLSIASFCTEKRPDPVIGHAAPADSCTCGSSPSGRRCPPAHFRIASAPLPARRGAGRAGASAAPPSPSACSAAATSGPAGDDDPAGDVRDAHRGVGGVHALPTGARGAEHVDAQVLVLDRDVDFLGFRAARRPWRPRCGCAPAFRWPAHAARGARPTPSAWCRSAVPDALKITSLMPPRVPSEIDMVLDAPATVAGDEALVHAPQSRPRRARLRRRRCRPGSR